MRMLVSVAALTIATPLAAQGAFNMGMMTNTLSQGANVQSEEARASQRTFPTLLRSPARGVRANPAAALYRPSMAARKRNVAQFIAKTKRLDPAAGADLERAFAKDDIMGQITGVMRRNLGLNPNDVADAMALYLVTAWYAARGSDDSKPSDLAPVARQLRRSITATPEFGRASDATKQEIAESMMVQATLAEQNVGLIKRTNPKLMPQFRRAIASGARATFGFDLTRMQLGPNGLE